MHILYCIPRYDSAAMGNRIHTEVIAAWRQHGVTAEVLSLAAGQPTLSTSVEEGVVVHRLPVSANWPLKVANRLCGSLLPYPYLAGAVWHFRRFLATRRYDLIHSETAFPLGLMVAMVPPRQRPPLALTLPGADIMAEPEFDYGYGRFRTVRWLLPWIFRQAALLRADSPQLGELAVRLGANPRKLVPMPYNITADSFPPPGDLHALRRTSRAQIVAKHQLDPARPIIVSLNRLHPFKGIAYLVDAMPHLRQAGLAPQLLIVGPSRTTPRFGDYGAYLAQRAAKHNLSADVLLVGGVPHEETMRYMAAADLAVVPSVAESFSRVVLEAAAVGTPPIVTRTTGVSDYVAAAEAGRVVDPRSGASIAEAIIELLGNPDAWAACSRRAYALAPNFSSERIAGALLELYRPIVERVSKNRFEVPSY
ncbi:glycosyltransferase family 4 protein [Candidatus Viridilinea mediisalina]|uniref:Glycosyl transferase family 1 n=1 Tax=Candidatus Viridilinea mediisalina TaxID=2024553 RepID=A0A2A6RFJ8_9CHLR|nr:glycosyltransferase family 4 protein [Candidatus Viridilinea mediisalina]PDW01655.1 glycosyl transferase family 1 [Candidatus Viridilinea mediisalina]